GRGHYLNRPTEPGATVLALLTGFQPPHYAVASRPSSDASVGNEVQPLRTGAEWWDPWGYSCCPVIHRPAWRTVQPATGAIVAALLGFTVGCGTHAAVGASSASCTSPSKPPASGTRSIPASFVTKVVARGGLACIV